MGGCAGSIIEGSMRAEMHNNRAMQLSHDARLIQSRCTNNNTIPVGKNTRFPNCMIGYTFRE
jgi:hypothetical protein